MSMSEERTIHLYCVRVHDIKDEFKLKLDFGENIKFTFNAGKQLRSRDNFIPFVYTLDINVKKDDNQQFYVNYRDCWENVNQYHLVISRPRPITVYPKIQHEETINQGHRISDDFENDFQFLFGIHFSKAAMMGPPGINGNYFDDFCLFTYYLLQKQMYYIFDILAHQFQDYLKNNNMIFDETNYRDFFETCILYIDNILPSLETVLITLKIIPQMIGVLPITKENFIRYSVHAKEFATNVMRHIRKQFSNVFDQVKEDEQPLFRRGLALLICIELFYRTISDDDDDENKVIFIEQLLNEKQRQSIANEILAELYKFNEPLYGNSAWLDLFNLANFEMIKLQDVYLIDSFELYIMFITKVSSFYPDINHFYNKIIREFERLIYLDYLQVNLESIQFLKTFTQTDQIFNHAPPNRLLNDIQQLVKMYEPLQYKINEFFNRSVVTSDNMEDISNILGYKSKCSILKYVEKDVFLYKSLPKNNSHDYYIKWFKCFLTNNPVQDDTSPEQWKGLLKAWAKCFEDDISKLSKVLIATDELLDSFRGLANNSWSRSYFIDGIIELCFRSKDIFRIITVGLSSVQNETFRRRFNKKFDDKYIKHQRQNLFTKLTDERSRFFQLIQINEQLQRKSIFINDLIQLIYDNVEVTKDDLLRDTFKEPTESSSTYIILFENPFRTSCLYEKVLEPLTLLWEDWEKNGFQRQEIDVWNRFTNEKRNIASEIWNVVKNHAGKTIQFEELIDLTNKQMEMLLTNKEKIILCINNYCQKASDKQRCCNLLKKTEVELKKKTIFSVSMPDEVKKLTPFADRLNPVCSSATWKKFLEWNLELIKQDIIVGNNDNQPTCFIILEQITEILDKFIARLKTLYNDKSQPLLPQLQELFPEKRFIDHEFNIIKSLIFDGNITVYIEILLDYWKNRDQIIHICQECMNVMKQYENKLSEKALILQNILEIDDQTSIETCISVYQSYCTYYSKTYSEQMLQLIAHWSSSKELLQFLYSLTSGDVDDLLEIVNDWDETLINTKIVLDFVLLKRFIHHADIMIETISKHKSLDFDDITNSFQKIWDQVEFKNILIIFESCSKSLSIIKRIHTKATNKEQSKRRRILDIMQNTQFYFCVHQLNITSNSEQYQFDVHITNNDWEPITFDDLKELRDRGRLIQYASRSNNSLANHNDNHIQQLQSFVSLVDTIGAILQNLFSLDAAGYPVIKQYPRSKRKFTCYKSDYHQLDKFKLSLEKQLATWEKQLCHYYKECINLTYFSYQQLSMVENSLHNGTVTMSDDPTYHLLKFIGIDPQSIRLDLLPDKSEQPLDLIKNVASIVKTERDNRHFSREGNKKVFVTETTNQGILRAIYSLFHLNNAPIAANQLFYCTIDTNWIELRAFIYRCFYSQTLHQLIRPELLSLVNQDKFVQLLNELINQDPKHFFLLSLITTVSPGRLHIINGLRRHDIVQIAHDQDMLNETDLEHIIQNTIWDKCILVTSRMAGLAKSTYIRNEIHRLKKNYVKFPINGDIDMDILTERLRDKRIQLASSTLAIHINLGAIDNIEQLNEFLYCLILFRCFRLGQTPIYVSNDIPIYIELDSSLHLVKNKDEITVFKYLKTQHIDRMDWNELEVNSSSHIQFVTNYLQAIQDGSINKRDINEETINNLDKPMCSDILREYFVSKENGQFVSWTQLSIFIAVYYKLFLSFSQCPHFMAEYNVHPTLRLDLLKSLLNSSNQFTSLSVKTIRESQRSIYNNESLVPFSEAIIRWDNSNPFTLIFTATHDPLFVYKSTEDIPTSLINTLRSYYRTMHDVTNRRGFVTSVFSWFSNKQSETNDTSSTRKPEKQLQESLPDHNTITHEQFFFRLTSLSAKFFIQKYICPKCFNQYENDQQQCTVCPTQDILIRPLSSKTQDIEDFQKLLAKKLESEYILTADNYIKMLLIYLRVQSNIPVLIMGETGCGKTALIQFLCQKMLDDRMEVFHIHAGVTNEKIIEKMHEYCTKAEKLSSINESKRLWIFLDEFNTTINIGLLKEIVCERTFHGNPIRKNIVLLGACNPQRRQKTKQESIENIGIKKYHLEMQRQNNTKNATLLYSVVPIPETMLEYVWDYGSLDSATEINYIKAILNSCEQLINNQTWLHCVANLISQSQQFVREREDVSSVSLRDVVRFCRFYNWFYKVAILDENHHQSNEPLFNSTERASLLALFLCYYFRLNSFLERKDYITMLEQSIQDIKPNISSDNLKQFLEDEKLALVNRMDLPPGTAKNRALTDNIFVLFTCILNHIPVILCGKPGSSKTSAVQILISNLKGTNSSDSFFQNQPELISVSYQGSQNCTSESIIKVFERADKYSDAKSDMKLLPVIVFDEIGLAELSPHNPLKVLHSELEIENCRHGFVGLSNWRLDASKMNRAVYLACPEPDLDDLKTTAISLSKSMIANGTQTIPFDNSIIEGLARAYMNLCEHMKQHYFGLRDYYSLIKGIMRDMVHRENYQQNLFATIRYQLSINFDGIADDSEFMWSEFCKHMEQDDKIEQYSSPLFNQVIDQSISSRHGRFLMLIGENESQFDYVQRYINIKHSAIPTRTLIGSTLSGDYFSNKTYTEQYNTRILMDIILYAETNIILFLRGLGHLYDNLYDLFNQNYALSANKKFCRIALGSLYHPRCFIHENFYCVVFVKQQDLDKYDQPFLNRFEKHRIDMDTLIDDQYKAVISRLKQWIDQLLSNKPNGNFPLLKHLFIEFSDGYLLNLVTEAFNHVHLSDDSHQNSNMQEIIKYCQDQMLRTSSFDLPVLLSLASTSTDTNNLIQRYYDIHTNLLFSSFVNQNLNQDKLPKLLIFTYTQIYDTIDYTSIHNYKNCPEVKLSHFKTELELIQRLKMHYETNHAHLLFIRVDYHQDHEHISMLKHILLNEQTDDKNCGICLIFHLQRNKLHQTNNDVFFNGWSSVMIDNLQEHKLIPKSILMNSSYGNLLSHLDFLNSTKNFNELINRCMIKFRYIVTNKNDENKINKRRDEIIEQLTSFNNDPQSLYSLVKNHLLNVITNQSSDQNQDWREDLLTNEILIGSCQSFNDALLKTMASFVDYYLSSILIHLEKHSLIDSYIFLNHTNEKIRNKFHILWSECWNTTMQNVTMPAINQNYIEMPFTFELHLPCSTIEYEVIRQIRENLIHDHPDNAWKQLKSRSIYGQSFNKMLDDPDIFTHYYHDQLTLIRNEANIHQLSTSFVQRLVSKTSKDAKYLVEHLLINHGELVEIMRLFELAIPFIDKEEKVFGMLEQQTLIDNPNEVKLRQNTSDLYLLVVKESSYYLLSPGSSTTEEIEYDGASDPFIEISLMNLIELLISSSIIRKINDIEQLIVSYGLFTQSMMKLSSYKHYEVNNFEKFNSVVSLASCLSTIFPNDQALVIFKQICQYSHFSNAFNTLEQIDKFINYLNKIINEQKPTMKIDQTLLKFENDLLRNWSIGNTNQSVDILKFINDHHLWKYSAKIFTIIDKSLELSSLVRNNNGQLPENDEYKQIDQYLCQLNDSTRQIELLMMMRIYIQLIFNENYQLSFDTNNRLQLTEKLRGDFDYFKENLYELASVADEQRLKSISLIAWIRYYILYYVYALKNDNRDDTMVEIDRFLVENNSIMTSTIKLHIIKQLCQCENSSFDRLCKDFKNRNLFWIRSMTTQSNDQRTLDTRYKLILPVPLFECHNEFIRVNSILSTHVISDRLRDLIKECTTRQDLSYCFIIWFIHHYVRFYLNNILPDEQLVKVIQDDLCDELVATFESIGYRLILSLCNNFNENSYFHLKPTMNEEDFHQRLVVLNIIALLLSYKSLDTVSYFSSLLFDRTHHMPQNYTEHFKQFNSLIGVASSNDIARIQMMHIRTQVDTSNCSIIRCSSNCPWILCLPTSELSNEQTQCPLCKKQLNDSQKQDCDEALQFISEYIKQSDECEKRPHLTLPISYHFIHLLTHSIFLFLNDFDFIPYSNRNYFQKCIEHDYVFLQQHLFNVDQYYIWLYKVINHMNNESFRTNGHLDSSEKVIEFEKLLENDLIRPHIDSVFDEIREYKLHYADFVYSENKNNVLVNFVDELVQDDNKYPLLNYFNTTNIHSIHILDHFHSKLHLLPNFEETYPLTTFILKHLSNYENIQYLYPIIKLTNYFIQNFNHQIKRDDANKSEISQYIKNDPILKTIYQDFLNTWSKINLGEISFEQRTIKSNCTFDNRTHISMFLLNKSNDIKSMIILASLQTLANLQNNLIRYFHSHIINFPNQDRYHMVSIQSIQEKDLFRFNSHQIRKLIVEEGLMVNYEYGMSQDLIYHYDKIESVLRNEISRLPWIDTKTIRYFNYQFELYDEDISLINNIRTRFQQTLFDQHQRVEINRVLNILDNNSILQLSGSLEYILTYLHTINNHTVIQTLTIQTFIRDYIHSRTCINNQIEQEPFSSINLQYVIDLYESIEESIFDKIFYDNIRDELRPKSFTNNDRISIVNQFIDVILSKKSLAECFRDLTCWISMLKRLLVRLLSSKTTINFDLSFNDYVKRTDMWKGDITKENIQTIEIDESIHLKHAFIILEGLKQKQKEITASQSLINSHFDSQTNRTTTQKSSATSSSSSRNERKRKNDFR